MELLQEKRQNFVENMDNIESLEDMNLDIEQVMKTVKDTKLRKPPGTAETSTELIRYGLQSY